MQESGTTRLVGVRHEAAHGLVGGRADKPVKWAGPGDAMGLEGAGKAPENARFRVSECAVKIEYCRPAHHHVISIARGQGPASETPKYCPLKIFIANIAASLRSGYDVLICS